MKAPNLLALSAAVLITAAGLASMNHGITRVPVAEINGIHVIDLAPVNVTPTAEELRAAALTAVTNTPALPAPAAWVAAPKPTSRWSGRKWPCPTIRLPTSSAVSARNNFMTITWNDSVPIYRQLRERVVAMILDGALNEGDPLPSVRQVAADFQINPLTVSKAYQELVDDQLVEKRRGLGMFVNDGAREALLKSERERFLREEWPTLFARLQRLGLDLKTLLREAGDGTEKNA